MEWSSSRHSRRSVLKLAASSAVLVTAAAVHQTVSAYPTMSAPASPTLFADTTASMPNTLAPDASSRFRAVAQALMDAMQQAKVPGATLGILANGQEEYATFGVESVDTQSPVVADTIFQMGSITKTYTATAIMRLMDMGKLDLDVPVRTYLPDLRLADPDVAARVTTAHLLTHTSDWYGDPVFDTGADKDAIARLVRETLPTLPQVAPLGTFPNYNNVAFALLGRIVEVVADKPYRDAMHDLVLAPLGLTSQPFDPAVALARSHAEGHAIGAQGLVLQDPLILPRGMEPAGALWSNARDLLRYGRFHLGDGTMDGARVLSQSTLKLMQTPKIPVNGTTNEFLGMNWVIADLGGVRILNHDGGTYGQVSSLYLLPEQQLAFVLIVNAAHGSLALRAAANAFWAQYLGVSPASGKSAGPQPLALPAEKRAEYAGSYVVPDVTITLRQDGDRLIFSEEMIPIDGTVRLRVMPSLPQNVRVTFIGEDKAVAGDDPATGVPLLFLRKPDGSVGWISIDMRLYPRTLTV